MNNAKRNFYYGSAAFALGMPTLPLMVHVPVIYAENLGIGLVATGLALFLARLFDVISDPVIGMVCDKTLTINGKSIGRRKPMIFIGAIVAGTGAILLMNPPSNANFMFLLIASIVLYLGWTLISIPYQAWAADLSNIYSDKTSITATREFFLLAGLLVAGIIPAIMGYFGYDEMRSISIIGWIMILSGIPLFYLLLKKIPEVRNSKFNQNKTMLFLIQDLCKNIPFIRLLSGWFINSAANGIPAVLFIIYMKDFLKADEFERGMLTLAYFLSGIIFIPFWLFLSKSYDKHTVWCCSMAVACIAFSAVPFLSEGDLFEFLIITIITGAALGGDLVIPPSMQADVVEYEVMRTKSDRTGMLFSLWTMASKIALAFSILIAFSLLSFLDFSVVSDGPKNLIALSMIYSILPVVFKIIVILLVWRYPLTQYKQSIISKRVVLIKQRMAKDGH